MVLNCPEHSKTLVWSCTERYFPKKLICSGGWLLPEARPGTVVGMHAPTGFALHEHTLYTMYTVCS